jgi:hypothetical protein
MIRVCAFDLGRLLLDGLVRQLARCVELALQVDIEVADLARNLKTLIELTMVIESPLTWCSSTSK